MQDLADTPWAHERAVFAEVEPGARVTAAPFHSDGATIGVRGPAPRFAEHTRVLGERCGLTVAQLDQLDADGVIGPARPLELLRPPVTAGRLASSRYI